LTREEQRLDGSIRGGLQSLLVVDDDPQILRQVEWALSNDYRVLTAGDRGAALEVFVKERPAVVILDLGLPPQPREATEGIHTIDALLSVDPLVKVLIVSGNSERENALLAIRRGAHDVFPKPVDMDELRVVVKRVYRRAALERDGLEAEHRAAGITFDQIVGASSQMLGVFSTARKVAITDVPVLITGESGTGKEILAAAIHGISSRSAGPFTAINCAAIPETLLESELFGYEKGAFTGAAAQRKGKLEYATGGTLFLDEIAELQPILQAKLLRFLQEKVIERVGGRETIRVDARVIAATNQELERAVREGRFREDLYFRLAVVRIVLPPLRERGADIIRLAERFVEEYSKEMGKPLKRFSRPALAALEGHPWPGNVRELQNRVKRAVVMAEGTLIGCEELELEPPNVEGRGSPLVLRTAREQLERSLVVRAIEQNKGNISRAARALGISRPTLYDMLARYGLRHDPGHPNGHVPLANRTTEHHGTPPSSADPTPALDPEDTGKSGVASPQA